MIENGIHFLLVPDANARKLVLARLVEQGSTIGVIVGTWPELITQVSNDYCMPVEQDTWHEALNDAMASMPDAFWAQSYQVDPDESYRILEAALTNLITSVPVDSGISTIDLKAIQSVRSRKILADFIALLAKVHRLPNDLSVMQQVCLGEHKLLREIHVHHHDAFPQLDLWQSSFIQKLNADAGAKSISDYQALLENSCDSVACNEPSTLRRLQQNLFSKAKKQSLDDSVQWLRVRDYLQEVETAAGMIQSMRERDAGLDYADFVLLIPHSDEYLHAVKSVFEQTTIPLSGWPQVTYFRDHGNEAVLDYLICQQKPVPVMAMTAFLVSPLMPWGKETGIELSDALMGGKYDIELPASASPLERQALSLILDNNETVPALTKSLKLFKKIITTQTNTSAFHVDRALGSIERLLEALSNESRIDWMALKQLIKIEQLREESTNEYIQEGVTVFLDSKEPWKQGKHLIVLGFNKGRYPSQSGTSAIFSDDDINELAQCGSTLVSRNQQNERYRRRFVRQIRSASESCTFFLSHLSADASSVHPSESLVYMHNLLSGYEEAEDLILNLDSETDRKLARNIKTSSDKQKTLHWSPCLEDINFKTDLLKLSETNKVRKLSPSRLGELMVSPLAWFLSWIDIELKEWAPEEPGPMILGNLAHGVYENIFKPEKPIPTAGAIEAKVPGLLEQELKRYAPYMLAQKWAIERHKLVDDITRSAIEWGDALSQLGASIVGNEIWLKGEYSGIAIHGQADCIFKLPDGQLAVVDYKKSSHGPRENQMNKGYDSQVSLYREMLKSGLPEPHQDLDVSNTEVLYYMMNSRKIISEKPMPGSANVPGWITIEADVAVNAMQLIKQRVDQVRQGKVILNKTSDEDFFNSEAGFKPYALDKSPLIRLFMKSDAGDAS